MPFSENFILNLNYSHSNIESFRRFSNTLISWFDEIVNSFNMYDDKRISNGKIEGTNSRIKTILKNANGYRNFSRMRNRIMYSLNKSSLPTSFNSEVIKRKGKKRGKYIKDK